MRLFPFRRKITRAFILSLPISLALIIAASQIEQYFFRHRAELLLNQIQSLELSKTPWPEARTSLSLWAAKSKFYEPCDEHQCALQISLDEFVFHFVTTTLVFVHLDDYIRWRLKLPDATVPFALFEAVALRLYMALGGQPASVSATVGMTNGIVSSKAFEVKTVVYPRYSLLAFLGVRGGPDFLLGGAYTVSQISTSVSGWCERQFTLHPSYMICGPDGCEGCVAGWAHFTPETNPADIRRLMDFNLSCLTRILPCRTQLDIMPRAWAQYLAERPSENASSP